MSAYEDFWEKPLTVDEFVSRLALARQELQGDEGGAMRAQRDWFLRTYPDPLDRLAYIRRKVAEVRPWVGRAAPK